MPIHEYANQGDKLSHILHSTSRIGDTPMARILHYLDIFVKSSLANLQRWSDPLFPSPLQLLGRDIHVNCVGNSVDGDNIAVPNQRDRPTNLSFWDDMSDDKAMGSKEGLN